MKTVIINGTEYKYEAIFVTKRAVGKNKGRKKNASII